MKEKNKVLLGRFLRVMVPLVLLAAMIIGNSLVEKDDRTGMVVLLLGLFAGILLLVGGWKGAAALYALVFTFACVLCVYVPLLYCGVNGILSAILTAVVILSVPIQAGITALILQPQEKKKK